MSRRSMMRMGTPISTGLGLTISGRLLSAPLEVLSIEGEESANALYEFRVRFTADPRDELAADRSLLHMPGQVTLGPASDARVVYGLVTKLVTEVGSIGRRPVYRAHIGPRATLLEKRRHCRIFQDQSVVQIVTSLFADHRIVYRTRLVGQYPARAYVVQHHESDWEFATRLLAECGILLYFDHPAGYGDAAETGLGNSEVVVLCDTAQYYVDIAGGSELLVRTGGPSQGLELPENAVTEFASKVQPATTVRLVRAFDFNRPTVELHDAQRVEVKEEPALVYEFGGEGDESPPEIQHARIRLEQDRTATLLGEGRSVCRRLVPARAFSLSGHTHPAIDGDYVVLSIEHHIQAAAVCPPTSLPYENRFLCVPRAVLLRPRSPVKRMFLGTETAVVVGPEGVEQYVDSLGRVKVQFHWDLTGKFNGQSSCWIRVAQSLAGAGWGAQFIPRVGMEVVVTFLGGDPDRPLITHAVYNATHPWPFPLPHEVTKSGIRTSSSPGGNGYHEFSMDDAAGKEKLFIHAQRDAARVVRNDDAELIGNDQRSNVVRDRLTEVGRRDDSVIGEQHSRAIGGDSQTGTVMQNGRIKLSTGGSSLELAGDNATLSANAEINLAAGSAIHLRAPLVTIEADAVEIRGTGIIQVDGGGLVTITGGMVKVNGGVVTEN